MQKGAAKIGDEMADYLASAMYDFIHEMREFKPVFEAIAAELKRSNDDRERERKREEWRKIQGY